MKAGILIGHMKQRNESSLIRTAEAFGINLVFVVGNRRANYSVSQGAEKQVLFIEFPDYIKFLAYARDNNHSIVCIENSNDAIEVSEIKKYPNNPIFITGNEHRGIPDVLLRNADTTIQIEQGTGYMPCLNTAIAGSIVMFDFFSKRKIHKEKRAVFYPYFEYDAELVEGIQIV